MPDFLALKRLTASDLTFFEPQFRKHSASNQKSINLNSDVLTGALYPRLDAYATAQIANEISFPLTIFGPNGAKGYPVRRKIIKGSAYKNWRLNGEFVHDPEDEPGRFTSLNPGDFALFGFHGKLKPDAVSLVLISASGEADARLHASLADILSLQGKSMMPLTGPGLAEALKVAGVGDEHPVSRLASNDEIAEAVEDLAQGGSAGAEVLQHRRWSLSPEDLAKARESALRNGVRGEELVNLWLGSQVGVEYEWTSQSNAVSPYDFIRRDSDGEVLVEVKTTSGSFEAGFHLSLNETRTAATSDRPYRIYRVFDLSEDGGRLSISSDIREFAKSLVDAHDEAMPLGVSADSFSVSVGNCGLSWSSTIELRPEENED